MSHIFHTFAAEMNRQGKRIGLAWLLLSVFVSMQLLSGMHCHEVVASAFEDCVECAHHVHHSGHWAVSADHLDNCLICQFLHFIYTPAATIVLVLLVILARNRRYFLESRMTHRGPSVLYTRGPPYVQLYAPISL